MVSIMVSMFKSTSVVKERELRVSLWVTISIICFLVPGFAYGTLELLKHSADGAFPGHFGAVVRLEFFLRMTFNYGLMGLLGGLSCVTFSTFFQQNKSLGSWCIKFGSGALLPYTVFTCLHGNTIFHSKESLAMFIAYLSTYLAASSVPGLIGSLLAILIERIWDASEVTELHPIPKSWSSGLTDRGDVLAIDSTITDEIVAGAESDGVKLHLSPDQVFHPADQ